MLGHEYGQISYFHNVGLQREAIGACLETKFGKIQRSASPPQNKIVLTCVL